MAAPTVVKLLSSDNEEFAFKREHIAKAHMLNRMLADLNVDIDNPTQDPVRLELVSSSTLRTVIAWLDAHQGEADPTDDEILKNRHNRRLSNEDHALFDTLPNRVELASVINAAYFLEVPGLIEALVRYVTHHLDRKSAEEMANWLEIALATAEPRAAPGDDEGVEAKRERVENGSEAEQ